MAPSRATLTQGDRGGRACAGRSRAARARPGRGHRRAGRSTGVSQFSDAADALLGAVAGKRAAFLGRPAERRWKPSCPPRSQDAVETRLEDRRAAGWSRRLYAGDATLWTGKDEGQVAGLDRRPRRASRSISAPRRRWRDKARGHQDAVLLGMGGSSLGPEVLAAILGAATTVAEAARARHHRSRPDRRASPPRSIRRRRCSSSPPNRARRWSPSCCAPISGS